MGRRLAKQTIYAIIFAAFWGLVILGLYALFFKSAPSCTDGIQNQNEEGIDCGGVCGGFCVSKLVDIKSQSIVRAFSPSQGQIGFFAQIANPNQEFAAKYFSYVWRVADTAGAMHEYPVDSFLYAGEIRNVGGVFDTVGFKADLATASLHIVTSSVSWVRSGEFVQPKVVVQDSSGIPEYNTFAIRGVIRNADPGSVSQITVLAALYDSRGQVVGVSPTKIAQLPAGQTAPFEVLYPLIPDVDLARTQVFVCAYRQ